MTINEVIAFTLSATQGVSFDVVEIAHTIYEIQDKTDINKVIRNIRSTLQKGAREGKWAKSDRGKYKAKENAEQGVLVNT